MTVSNDLFLIIISIGISMFLLGAITVSMAAILGYRAGRKSLCETPMSSWKDGSRSITRRSDKKPQPEPEDGDIFNEAAYGEDNAPRPTIINQPS